MQDNKIVELPRVIAVWFAVSISQMSILEWAQFGAAICASVYSIAATVRIIKEMRTKNKRG